MYIVRILRADGREDFKAFAALPDAKKRFRAGYAHIPDIVSGVALFEAPGIEDARAAVEAVKTGKAVILDKDYNDELNKLAGEFIDELIAKGEFPVSEPDEKP
ncbi:MAG: hypothetical protein ABSG66_04135 [Stellaceae bacterium]|jgi:hypothetical protein